MLVLSHLTWPVGHVLSAAVGKYQNNNHRIRNITSTGCARLLRLIRQLQKRSKWSLKRINPLLTAVNFIRSGVVSAVIVAITDKGCTDATSIAAGEFSSWVTRGKGAALLITVVTTVICVVTGVAERHTAPVVTGKVHG